MKNLVWILLLIGLSHQDLKSQIYLRNPSFESDAPQDATMPSSWLGCNMGTTPDILPGFWGVMQEASDGNNFLGLITRRDGTYEAIAQRLDEPLQPNECYKIAMDLCYSTKYVGYNHPIVLRIWGGSDRCMREQLFVETDMITNRDWETFSFILNTKQSVKFIIFEAYFPNGKSGPYLEGNILLDHIRSIRSCDRA